jgi:hypothetical protein
VDDFLSGTEFLVKLAILKDVSEVKFTLVSAEKFIRADAQNPRSISCLRREAVVLELCLKTTSNMTKCAEASGPEQKAVYVRVLTVVQNLYMTY